jgi:hypothetical protein
MWQQPRDVIAMFNRLLQDTQIQYTPQIKHMVNTQATFCTILSSLMLSEVEDFFYMKKQKYTTCTIYCRGIISSVQSWIKDEEKAAITLVPSQ